MLMAIKLAKLGDDALERDVGALETRMRAARPNDPSWRSIYEEALAIVPRVLAAQKAAEKKNKEDGAAQEQKKLAQSVALAVTGLLQKIATEYSSRLSVQEGELLEKA